MAPQGDTKSMTLRIDENLAERVRTIAEVEETTGERCHSRCSGRARRASTPRSGVSSDAEAKPSAS